MNKKKLMKTYKEIASSDCSFENEILYDMCKRSHSNKNEREVRGKLLVIGRTYAAALERTPANIKDVYYKTAIKISDSRLDDMLIEAKKSKDDIHQYLSLVNYLNKLFKGIVKTNKISLASKYLHFHHPEIPIYDSISKKSLASLVKIEQCKKSVHYNRYWSKGEYEKHLVRFFCFKEYLETLGFKNQSARNIDSFLLNYKQY